MRIGLYSVRERLHIIIIFFLHKALTESATFLPIRFFAPKKTINGKLVDLSLHNLVPRASFRFLKGSRCEEESTGNEVDRCGIYF